MSLSQNSIDAIHDKLGELRAEKKKLDDIRDVYTAGINSYQALKAPIVARIDVINAQMTNLKADLPEVPDE